MDSTSSSPSKISPVFLWVIVILAVIFFLAGLLHLLIRFVTKRSSSSPTHQSNRSRDPSGSLQRQLQQLFRLHDSGLDQASVDALPVFFYKDIVGLKEPFDCAVCLCEFSDEDKLRLLPACSHAFHIQCIDTWLLSNTTCPLCRGTLLGSSGMPVESSFSCNSSEVSNHLPDDVETGFSHNLKSVMMDEALDQKRVYSVRLGKFKGVTENDGEENGERRPEESSSCNLDARRCFSLGSFQYVVGDSNLRVAMSDETGDGSDLKLGKERCHGIGISAGDGDVDGKKVSSRIKGESFSVSKVWLWSKRSKFPGSSDSHMGFLSSVNVGSSTDNPAHIV